MQSLRLFVISLLLPIIVSANSFAGQPQVIARNPQGAGCDLSTQQVCGDQCIPRAALCCSRAGENCSDPSLPYCARIVGSQTPKFSCCAQPNQVICAGQNGNARCAPSCGNGDGNGGGGGRANPSSQQSTYTVTLTRTSSIASATVTETAEPTVTETATASYTTTATITKMSSTSTATTTSTITSGSIITAGSARVEFIFIQTILTAMLIAGGLFML